MCHESREITKMAKKYHLIKCLIDKCEMLHDPNKFPAVGELNALKNLVTLEKRASLVESLL